MPRKFAETFALYYTPLGPSVNVNGPLIELVNRSDPANPTVGGSLRDLREGIRFYLCRQLGPHGFDDKVHPRCDTGDSKSGVKGTRATDGIRAVVRRQVAAHIEKMVNVRKDHTELDSSVDPRSNPEESAVFRQKAELIRTVLHELSNRDREILTRFYLREQSQTQICAEMGLTATVPFTQVPGEGAVWRVG